MQPAWQRARQSPAAEHRPVANNLTRALRNYALVSPTGIVKEMPGMTLIASGIRYAVFNAAILNEPVITSVEELTGRLVAASGFFLRQKMPWSCWVCRDHLSVQARSVADLVLQRHRLQCIAEHLGLEAGQLAPPTRKLPQLETRPVATPETRRDFAAVTGEAFDLPSSVSKQIYEGPGLWRGDYKGYVGYAGGKAVCTAATCSGPEEVGLYSVGTAFAYRGRGYAETITRAVIGAAGQRRTMRSVLQSTPAGLGLYQRLGYQPVTSVLVYAMV
jgi:ribosomal protein S18 acetylase RimI-like enzyme